VAGGDGQDAGIGEIGAQQHEVIGDREARSLETSSGPRIEGGGAERGRRRDPGGGGVEPLAEVVDFGHDRLVAKPDVDEPAAIGP
jgi:hypothetical protein